MSTNLGALAVYLTADTRRYEAALRRSSRRTRTWASTMRSSARWAGAGMAAGTAAFVAQGLRSNVRFESAMTRSTSIITGLTEQQRRAMEKSARDMATRSRFAAHELAGSYYYLASAGLNVEQQIASLPTVTRFATAGNFELAAATDLLTDAQSALGMSSKDAVVNQKQMIRLSDALVKSNTLANASVEQFSLSLTTKSGAALRNLGKDVEEGLAVLAAYADQGLKAQESGTALSIVLRDLQTASRKNSQEWSRLGISVYDSTGKMRNIADIIADIEKAFDGMSDKQRAAALAQMGMQDKSQSYTLSLVGMSEKIKEYERALRGAGGTTEQVANRQMGSLENRMLVVGNKFDMVSQKMTRNLLPALEGAVDLLDKGLERLDRLEAYSTRMLTGSESLEQVNNKTNAASDIERALSARKLGYTDRQMRDMGIAPSINRQQAVKTLTSRYDQLQKQNSGSQLEKGFKYAFPGWATAMGWNGSTADTKANNKEMQQLKMLIEELKKSNAETITIFREIAGNTRETPMELP